MVEVEAHVEIVGMGSQQIDQHELYPGRIKGAERAEELRGKLWIEDFRVDMLPEKRKKALKTLFSGFLLRTDLNLVFVFAGKPLKVVDLFSQG